MRSGQPLLRHVRVAAESEQQATVLRGRFREAGYAVVDDAIAAEARADEASVIGAVRVESTKPKPTLIRSTASVAKEASTQSPVVGGAALFLFLFGARLYAITRDVAKQAPRSREGDGETAWLEVWDVRSMVPTGLELYVVTDHDATVQLDALAEALDLQREIMTVRPRGGWQGYGYPN